MLMLFTFLAAFIFDSTHCHQSMTPQLDIINVPGDNPPYVPVKIGYPAQGPFNLALYTNYHTSWLYSSNGGANSRSKRVSNKQCFNERRSSTFTLPKNITKNSYNGQVSTDLLRINNNEYEFKFGLVQGKCSSKRRSPYSGVFGLAYPLTEQRDDLNILSGLKGRTEETISFFIPSEFSQQQSGALIFGTKYHPACQYDSLALAEIRGNDQFYFQVSCCGSYTHNTNTGTYTQYTKPKTLNATIALDLEDIYGPAEDVYGIYKALGAKRLNKSDRYYVPCDKLSPYAVVTFDVTSNAISNQRFRFYSRHLVTPLAEDKTKCVVNVRTGGFAADTWIFGKKFAERFCISMHYNLHPSDTSQFNFIAFGTVYDISEFESQEKLTKLAKLKQKKH